MTELKAKPGCCEEASPLSHNFYIPCNRPAVSLIAFSGEGPYRMCEPCATHNVHNRGAFRVGSVGDFRDPARRIKRER